MLRFEPPTSTLAPTPTPKPISPEAPTPVLNAQKIHHNVVYFLGCLAGREVADTGNEVPRIAAGEVFGSVSPKSDARVMSASRYFRHIAASRRTTFRANCDRRRSNYPCSAAGSLWHDSEAVGYCGGDLSGLCA